MKEKVDVLELISVDKERAEVVDEYKVFRNNLCECEPVGIQVYVG